MKRKNLILLLAAYFTFLLFVAEPLLVIKYYEKSLGAEYLIFNMFKWITLALVCWVFYNNYTTTVAYDEDSSKKKKNNKYKLMLGLICFAYISIIGVCILYYNLKTDIPY